MRYRKWIVFLREKTDTIVWGCVAIFFLCVYFVLVSSFFLLGFAAVFFLLIFLPPQSIESIAVQEYEMECIIISILRMAKFRPHPLSCGWMRYQELKVGVSNYLGRHFRGVLFEHVLQSLIERSIVDFDSVLDRYVQRDARKSGLCDALRLNDDSYVSRKPRCSLKNDARDTTTIPIAEKC